MSIKDLMAMAEGNCQPNFCCGPLVVPLATSGLFQGVTALQLIGGLSTVAGAIQGAKAGDAQAAAQQQQLQAQANADRYNATIAQQNADIVKGQTQAEVDKADRERRLRLGSAIAAGGSSGIGTESFGDILQSSAAQEELNLLTIESEGLLRERNYTTQSDLLTASAANAAAQIPLVKSAAKASKAATLIGGATKAAGMF